MPTNADPKIIENFLYHEADLLDSGDLETWRDLFTEDGTYWMPVVREQLDPYGHISILFENRAVMAIRAANLGHRLAASMEYPIRSSHIIGNCRLISEDSQNHELTVTANFQAVVYYREQTLFAGTYTYQLIPNGNSFLIKQKRVDLINCDADHKSILIYI